MALNMSDVSADNLIYNNYSKYNNSSVDTDVDVNDTTSGYLDFEGYLTLLRAQMTNQDLNNSMSDSEFIQQMASYSMMESISQMNKQSQLTYSASLIGKAVTVTDSNGTPDTGIVEAVTMTKDGCNLLVNGNQYASSKITDVVDGTIYTQLNRFTGHKVEIDDGEGGTITGTVTSVYISSGNGFVVLNNKDPYNLSMVSRLVDEPAEDGEAAEGEGTENAENSGENPSVDAGSDDSGNSGDNSAAAAATAAVDESAAATASGYVYRGLIGTTSKNSRNNSISSRGIETLLDMVDGEDSADGSGLMSYATAAVRSNLEAIASRRIAQVEESVAASGVSGDSDRVPAPSVYNQYIIRNSAGNDYTGSNNGVNSSTAGISYSSNKMSARSGVSSDSGRMPAPSVYNNYMTGRNTNTDLNIQPASESAAAVNNGVNSVNTLSGGNRVTSSNAKSTYDTGAEFGSISVSDMNAAAQNLETFKDTGSVLSSSGTVSTRSYAPEYVLEAAFADSVGTKMGDIRYIGNTDIMDRIDTSEVIAYMQKGRAVTDIGWCGKGRLGEVLTFPDGKQRVEVILGGNSSYFYTTGKYTLNEMFNKNVAPGYWVGKLTPQERAIVHYAEEYSPAEKAEMEAFEQYCVRHAASMNY